MSPAIDGNPDMSAIAPALPPYQKHRDTSRAAAAGVREDSAWLRHLVYDHVQSCGPGGCTDAEGQEATGLDGNTWRPRRVELMRNEWVRDSGRFRLTQAQLRAAVWVAT